VEAMTMGTRIAVMNEGELQQVDTPQTLYDRPANRFVAGFIGSPAMNFFDVTLRESDGQLMIEGESFHLPVPADRVPALRAYLGQPLILGVRPDDLHDPDFAPPGIVAAPLQARVDVTELMGNEVILYLLVGGHVQAVARVDPRTHARVGNEVNMVINVANLHIFDQRTEVAVR
jgi:multiple sugar transport system ATP-binding protein